MTSYVITITPDGAPTPDASLATVRAEVCADRVRFTGVSVRLTPGRMSATVAERLRRALARHNAP